MRSTDRKGGLFDSLYLSSFGFGGDPNDLLRLRVEKNKWYNFVGLYRRDVNFFDDNLFGNPLNTVYPVGTNGLLSNYGYVNSPKLQNTTRNMGDFNLTLLPQSPVRFRLGYSRNDNQGLVDNTIESPAGFRHHQQFPLDLGPLPVRRRRSAAEAHDDQLRPVLRA